MDLGGGDNPFGAGAGRVDADASRLGGTEFPAAGVQLSGGGQVVGLFGGRPVAEAEALVAR